MRRFAVPIALILLACKGEPTPPVVTPVTFLATGAAGSLDATLPQDVADAHDALQSLHAVLGLMAVDVDVQDLMNVPTVAPDPATKCWTTALSGNSRTLSYTLCGTFVEGQARIEQRTDQSRLVTTTPAFTYDGRGLGGGLVLDPTLVDSPVFQTSAADADGNASDTLLVRVDARQIELGLAGRLELDTTSSRVMAWGTASVGDVDIVIGGATPEEVDTDTRPAEVSVTPFVSECRCQVDGQVTYDVSLPLEVGLDIASALEDAGTLWPELPVAVDGEVAGRLTVQPGAACGDWTGTFEPAAPITVTGQAVRAAIELGCASNSFGSEESCERVRQGAVSLESLEITLSDRVKRELVEVLGTQFDNGFCEVFVD
ncbi:MAG: hypothetical protein H6736_01380 [Alphaproteobacteria bacterium]|nr:hypothetical protein [Alphaproteobacteria bacterium]MCB9690442.1 hypothetical protein [Alphaproteobacteria bacterium]